MSTREPLAIRPVKAVIGASASDPGAVQGMGFLPWSMVQGSWSKGQEHAEIRGTAPRTIPTSRPGGKVTPVDDPRDAERDDIVARFGGADEYQAWFTQVLSDELERRAVAEAREVANQAIRDAVEQVKVEARAIKEAPVEETVIAEELTQTPDQV